MEFTIHEQNIKTHSYVQRVTAVIILFKMEYTRVSFSCVLIRLQKQVMTGA
jgi:hypothetical protein